MRAKQQNQPPAANYEQENKVLRDLFMARMKVNKEKKEDQFPDQMEEEMMRPSIKKEQKVNEIVKNQKPAEMSLKLYLNIPYFDSREKRPEYFIKIFSFFNEDVTKPKKKVSENVESIFITTFGFETETFQQLLTESKVKLVVLNESQEKQKNRVIKGYGGFENFTVILKAKNQGQRYGVFHTKLWLIKFKSFLRVVICTSNQHIMDWAVWQNAFWYQDFPLKTPNEPAKNDQANEKFNFDKDFYQTLSQVLSAMLSKQQLEEFTSINLQKYSFENIKVILIPSIPGRHQGAAMKRQGLCKLKQVMKVFNTIPDPVLTYNTTSLGVIEREFVSELYTSFCPKKPSLQVQKFRLVYPTKRYIQEETGGQAQVLFLTSENLKKSDIAKQVLHKYDTNPLNPILGSIPHLKTVLIEPSQGGEDSKGILYLGSHNMTKAAWGKLEKQGSQLYIGNSELGLLLLDVPLGQYRRWCPFKHPPAPYGPTDEPFQRDFLK